MRLDKLKLDLTIIKEAKMIRVIGQLGCSNCEIAKLDLKKKGIDFTYELMMSLSEEEQDRLYNMAEEKNMTKMPLILLDDVLVSINDLQ
jgi:glutaredoxin